MESEPVPVIEFTHEEVIALLWVYGEFDDRPSPALASAIEKLNVGIKRKIARILDADEERHAELEAHDEEDVREGRDP
jgi:hypothetical protein